MIKESELKDILQSMMDYIGVTQPMLDKQARDNKLFREKVAEAVDSLISSGLVSKKDRGETIRNLSHDPVKVAEVLIKVSGKVGPSSMGGPSNKLDARTKDPIIDFIMS